MDKIKNTENSGISVHGNRVNNLRFADDIDIEQSNEKLQEVPFRSLTLPDINNPKLGIPSPKKFGPEN